jgi:hypothetical protein
VQVACHGRRGFGHRPEQRCFCDELLACSRRCVRVVDIEVGIDELVGPPAQLTRSSDTR